MAIERAVAERIGPGASVTVSDLVTTVAPMPGLEAIPDPGGRSGRPVRFLLVARGARVGTAVATVRVQALHARAVRVILREASLEPASLVFANSEIKDVAFRHLPTANEVGSLTARRDIAAGEAITDANVLVPPLVRSGDSVKVTVRIGEVEAQGMAVASGSGHIGETIRVMQRSSRKLLNARVTGSGTVELIP